MIGVLFRNFWLDIMKYIKRRLRGLYNNMKRNVIILSLIMLILTGCSNNTNSQYRKQSFEQNKIDIVQDERQDEDINICGGTINVLDSDGESIGYHYEIYNDMVELTVDCGVSITDEEPAPGAEVDVPIRMWIIENGKLIDFSIDGGNVKLTSQDITMKHSREQHKIQFNGRQDMGYVTIMICMYPDYSLKTNYFMRQGLFTYSFVNDNNKALNNRKPVMQDTVHYIELSGELNNSGIDVWDTNLESDYLSSREMFYTPHISRESGQLWVKFNYSPDNDPANNVVYRIIVICDGQVIPAFSGQFSCQAYTPVDAGLGFQCVADLSAIPKDGEHTLIACAIPDYVVGEERAINKFTTNFGCQGCISYRTRIVIE